MWCLTNLQQKLIYMYYIGEPIGSDSWHRNKRHDEDKEEVQKACQTMEVLVMQLFANHEWRFNNRISS